MFNLSVIRMYADVQTLNYTSNHLNRMLEKKKKKHSTDICC